jgi:hypothetical protein
VNVGTGFLVKGIDMRSALCVVALSLGTAALVAAQEPQADVTPLATVVDAATVLAATRTALGGEQRLSAVRTFVARGRTLQVRGSNLVPIEFEIECALPDRYRRTDEVPAQQSAPTSIGFSGDVLIQVPAPAGRGGSLPGPGQQAPARRARVAAAKQDFARLTLGMFAGSFSSYPLTFTYAGRAAAPQGEADVLDVTGPAGVAMRLFIDRLTHLPIMVSWQTAPIGGDAAAPGESRLYYADYREVDGLKLPFRLRRSVGPDTVEETTFDQFQINAVIAPAVFAVEEAR